MGISLCIFAFPTTAWMAKRGTSNKSGPDRSRTYFGNGDLRKTGPRFRVHWPKPLGYIQPPLQRLIFNIQAYISIVSRRPSLRTNRATSWEKSSVAPGPNDRATSWE